MSRIDVVCKNLLANFFRNFSKKDLKKTAISKVWKNSKFRKVSYVGKISDDRGFYFLPTVQDFADKSDNRNKSVPDTPCLCVIGDWSPAM